MVILWIFSIADLCGLWLTVMLSWVFLKTNKLTINLFHHVIYVINLGQNHLRHTPSDMFWLWILHQSIILCTHQLWLLTGIVNAYTLGCVKKHFFPLINLKLPENCPWVWTTNTLKYQYDRSMFHPGNRFPWNPYINSTWCIGSMYQIYGM